MVLELIFSSQYVIMNSYLRKRQTNKSTPIFGLIGFTIAVYIYILWTTVKDIEDFNKYIYGNAQEVYDVCYKRRNLHDESFEYLQDIMDSKKQPKIDESIFFIDSACKIDRLLELRAREACAIESAARQNPYRDIFVLFVSPVAYARNQLSSVIEALSTYPNVFMRNLNILTFSSNTPVQQLLNSGKIFKSKYRVAHLSDLIRLLTLYKFGGTYFDLDYVLLKSLDGLDRNFVGAQNATSIGNSVLSFSRNGNGHELLNTLLKHLNSNYDGEVWDINGPTFLTSTFKRVCQTNEINQMNRSRCDSISVYPSSVFYPIGFKAKHYLFEKSEINNALDIVKDSVGIHLWNRLTSQIKLKVKDETAYNILAKEHCPRVYRSCGEDFN